MYDYDFYPFVAAEGPLFEGQPLVCCNVNAHLWKSSMEMNGTGIRILDHLRKTISPGEEVYHEPIYRRGAQTPNDHRFYFTSERDFKAFVDGIDTTYRSDLFDGISDLSGDHVLAGMLEYRLPRYLDQNGAAFYFWCSDNLKGKIYTNGSNRVIFTSSEDLMLFRLKLMDDDALNLSETYFEEDGEFKRPD